MVNTILYRYIYFKITFNSNLVLRFFHIRHNTYLHKLMGTWTLCPWTLSIYSFLISCLFVIRVNHMQNNRSRCIINIEHQFVLKFLKQRFLQFREYYRVKCIGESKITKQQHIIESRKAMIRMSRWQSIFV